MLLTVFGGAINLARIRHFDCISQIQIGLKTVLRKKSCVKISLWPIFSWHFIYRKQILTTCLFQQILFIVSVVSVFMVKVSKMKGFFKLIFGSGNKIRSLKAILNWHQEMKGKGKNLLFVLFYSKIYQYKTDAKKIILWVSLRRF